MQVLKDVVVLAGILTWQLGLFFFRPNGQDHLAGHPPNRATLRASTRQVTAHLRAPTTPSVFVVIMSDQEQKIQKAVKDVNDQRYSSIRQAALANDVARATLTYRIGGRKAKSQMERKNRRFTNQEEKSIVQWLNDLQRQHMSPNYL
jgi:hypothetical protein